MVPGNIDVPTFAGSNRLLRDGAIPVCSGWDVVSEYKTRYPDKLRMAAGDRAVQPVHRENNRVKVAQTVRLPREKEGTAEKSHKKVIDNGASAPYIDVNDTLPQLSADESAIVSALKDGERLVDDLIAETGMTTGKLLASLTMLELKGVICRLPGKRVSIKK